MPEWVANKFFPKRLLKAASACRCVRRVSLMTYCYRHGAATYGYTQADCDYLLKSNSFRICLFISVPNLDRRWSVRREKEHM